MIAEASGASPKVVSNAAESALEHHLGMTCDPVAGYVQVPCIERCAYGAVKAWTAYCIASEEIPDQRRVDLDTTIAAMALTAKEMNSKYKETSEGGLAVSVVLCWLDHWLPFAGIHFGPARTAEAGDCWRRVGASGLPGMDSLWPHWCRRHTCLAS
jgi:hypothetical protein